MVKGRSAARVERYFDAHAQHYDRQMGGAERWLLGEQRRWATSRATGDVLELAVGTGLNLPLYGDQVRHLLGIDLSNAMLECAQDRLGDHHLEERMEVQRGDVQHLDLPDSSLDTVVATYAMCTIPDPHAALLEARRVLRPGGRLVLVDHGPGRSGWLRVAQRALNLVTVRWQSDDLLRDTRLLVAGAGFEIVEADQVGVAGLAHRVHARKPTPRF